MKLLIKLSKIFGIIFVVIGLLLAGILAVISFIDINQYKDTITAQVKELTGRELALKGDLQLKVGLSPTVIVEGAQFANAPWGSKADMVTVGRLEMIVKLIPLLSGDITVKRLVLVDPNIFLETDKQGQGNWELDIAKAAPEQPSAEEQKSGVPIHLVEVRIENGKFGYRDGVSGETKTFHLGSLTLQRAGPSELNIALQADYDGVPVKLQGKTGLIYNLLNNAPYPLQLEGTAGKIDIALLGRLEQPMEAKGMDVTLSAKAADLATISKLAKSDMPKIGPLELKARIADSPSGYELGALALKFGKSELNGDVTLKLAGERPAVSAKLDSKLIDLSVLTADKPKQASKPREQKTASTALIDPAAFEPMRSLDADVALNIKKLRTADLELENLQTTVTLKNGKLDVKPLKVQFAGSDLGGNVSFNPFAKRPLITAQLNSNRLDLTAFQTDEKAQKEKPADTPAKEKPLKTPVKLFSPMRFRCSLCANSMPTFRYT